MALNEEIRAKWNKSNKKIFFELCIEECNRGGRIGATLKTSSWNKIIEELKNKYNLKFQQKQLKNFWDISKANYQLWTKVIGYSGHGFNSSTNTLDWPKDKWDDVIKAIPKAKKFRSKPLECANQLAALFDGVLATGGNAWNTHMEGKPQDITGSSSQSHPPLESDPESADSLSSTRVLDRLEANNVEVAKRDKRRKKEKDDSRCKKEKDDTRPEIRDFLLLIAKEYDDGPTIEECFKSLNKMTMIKEDNPLYITAINTITMKKEWRKMWMMIKDEQVRVNWLKSLANKPWAL